jgi:hypothetical protein
VTDVTTDQGQDGAEFPAADEQLLRELTERARAGGLRLTGEGGVLGKLTKMVVEGALEGELDDHPGYEKNAAGRDCREFPQWPPGQDGAHRGRAGGTVGAAGPRFQLRAEKVCADWPIPFDGYTLASVDVML